MPCRTVSEFDDATIVGAEEQGLSTRRACRQTDRTQEAASNVCYSIFHSYVVSAFPPPLRSSVNGATAGPSRSAKREGWQADPSRSG
jgi:hypothetical protein